MKIVIYVLLCCVSFVIGGSCASLAYQPILSGYINIIFDQKKIIFDQKKIIDEQMNIISKKFPYPTKPLPEFFGGCAEATQISY